jgi:tetratricopeptide (TPR) repeat protein
MANPAIDPMDQELLLARQLLEKKDFAAATTALKELYSRRPTHRDVLYMYAAALRYEARLSEALARLDTLNQMYPAYGRGFQERGHCLRAMNQPLKAIEAYEHAVRLDNALPSAWRNLALLNRQCGRLEQAEKAKALFNELAKLPDTVVTAQSLMNEGARDQAEALLRQYLLSRGDQPDAMRLLAAIGVSHQALYEAELLLAGALTLQPDNLMLRFEYAMVLSRRHKHTETLPLVEQLLAVDPEREAFLLLHAVTLSGIGQFERAIDIYCKLLQRARPPSEVSPEELHLSLGHAYKTTGRLPEAIAEYKSAINIRTGFGESWWSLANLKTYQFGDDDISSMRAMESRQEASEDDRIHLCFALGKALEDKQQYPQSFEYYDRGNRLKKLATGYDPALFEVIFGLQKKICTAQFFAERAGWGAETKSPIFIVGMPRAGSTLIEHILASHSLVEGTNELADISRLAQALNGIDSRPDSNTNPRYPGILPRLTADQCREFGAEYIRAVRILRTDKPFFIDKNPNNFRHIGLIHLILPQSRIIDARRSPMDCCFSNFKQLFARGQEFTYSQEDIARYYLAYVDLMAHWDTVLPNRVLRMQHEALVEDPESEIRRMLDFLQLPFEQGCLESHKSQRSVRTASSEQVRKPINKEGFGQWRPYAQWLEPLKMALDAPVSNACAGH